jgi:hypothetical protein
MTLAARVCGMPSGRQAYSRCLARLAHRLRAIGHLHEAEDKLQAFSALHAAIRDARRAYQSNGTMPDWEATAASL